MRPVFADPKTDVVFKRIFGSEAHKPLLIELLNALLELSADHWIVDLKYLSSEQHMPVEELNDAGVREGLGEGLREVIRALCQAFEIDIDAERKPSWPGWGAAS